LKRKQRKRTAVPVVALVGYTNAGKSTLLRRLTDASVLVENRLFSTLDPTTRRLEIAPGRVVLLTDTVGFVRKLPHQLVEAFRSTLEEVLEATVLLHVVDATGTEPQRQIDAVNTVLKEIGAVDKPTIIALNKIDLLDDDTLTTLRSRFPEAIFCSAAKGDGIDAVIAAIDRELARIKVEITVEIPFDRGELVARIHAGGDVIEETYSPEGTRVVARVSRDLMTELEAFLAPTH
jgi:GTPase